MNFICDITTIFKLLMNIIEIVTTDQYNLVWLNQMSVATGFKQSIGPWWRHDTQHNNTQHNDTQHYYTQHNDTQINDTQHNDTQHNDTQIMTL